MASINDLNAVGQAVWLDYIRRDMLENGELRRLIADGLRGLTSNPAIFEKAIGGSNLYDARLKEAAAKGGNTEAIYERVAIPDIQDAADALRMVYDSTSGNDGYASFEVSPQLAADCTRTVSEAQRLWKEINRPNVMIKVPGTDQGIEAFGELIGAGINVNVTLLFSVNAYRRVAETYIQAVEARAATGADIRKLASVASFFVSRIDSAVDIELEAKGVADLAGKTAVANAKLAYEVYEQLFSSQRWKAVAAKGGQAQRLLWASTGTKNQKYSDVLYLEELIGRNTVNTVPPATLAAFVDHGKVRERLSENLASAKATMKAIADAGIDFDVITERLLKEGLEQFAESFKKLLAAVQARTA